MKPVPFCLAALLVSALPAAAQSPLSPAHAPPPAHAREGTCEIRPDALYVNPRLPLGRAAYAQRPACRTTWASGPSGPGLFVQGAPIQVEAPPVRVGGLMLYLVPPEIVVRPSEVTVEPPEIHGGEVVTPESPAPPSGD